MDDLRPKKVSESAIEYYPNVIFPNDLNSHNTIFGGRVLSIIDQVAGIVAMRHSQKACVTAEIDSVRFIAPALQGETLVVKAALNRAWSSSMEVGVKIFAENYTTAVSRHVASAYLTFVALNEDGRPTRISPVEPETGDEKRRYLEAEERRNHRLKIEAERKRKQPA